MQGQDEEQPAFNQADFPSLGGGARQQGHAGMANGGGDGGGLGGAELYSSLAQQKVTNQLSEFSIQTEDFPALPGAPTQRGGPDDQQDGQVPPPPPIHTSPHPRTHSPQPHPSRMEAGISHFLFWEIFVPGL